VNNVNWLFVTFRYFSRHIMKVKVPKHTDIFLLQISHETNTLPLVMFVSFYVLVLLVCLVIPFLYYLIHIEKVYPVFLYTC
jgi:hypothetical protein